MLTEHGHKIAAKLKSVHDTVVQRTTEYNGTMAETDPFFTYETAAHLAHTDGFTSIHTRLNEKLLRLSALAENGVPSEKAVAETCGDIIGHSVLLWQFVENYHGQVRGDSLPVLPELPPSGATVKESPLQGLKRFLTGRK
jgi:hypothetical protein